MERYPAVSGEKRPLKVWGAHWLQPVHWGHSTAPQNAWIEASRVSGKLVTVKAVRQVVLGEEPDDWRAVAYRFLTELQVVMQHVLDARFAALASELRNEIRAQVRSTEPPVGQHMAKVHPAREWMKANQAELAKYVGEFVAVHPTQGVVAHDLSLEKVLAEAEKVGVSSDVLFEKIA